MTTNEKGEKVFTERPTLEQTFELPVALYNETNMSKKAAYKNHKNAVRAAKTALKPQGL